MIPQPGCAGRGVWCPAAAPARRRRPAAPGPRRHVIRGGHRPAAAAVRPSSRYGEQQSKPGGGSTWSGRSPRTRGAVGQGRPRDDPQLRRRALPRPGPLLLIDLEARPPAGFAPGSDQMTRTSTPSPSGPSASTLQASSRTMAASCTAGNRMPVRVGSAWTWREANRVSSTGVAKRSTSALTSRWATRWKTRETSKVAVGDGGSLSRTTRPASPSRRRHSHLVLPPPTGAIPRRWNWISFRMGPFRSLWTGPTARRVKPTTRKVEPLRSGCWRGSWLEAATPWSSCREQLADARTRGQPTWPLPSA
jgi:hypothetical protein